MRMNRRNVLIGVGAVVAGGGAALGTGAFSQVEADRQVSFGTTEDADALLGIQVLSQTLQGSAGDDDDVIEIDVDNLNMDALTTFDNALEISNNHAEDNIDVSISEGEIGDNGDDLLVDEAGEDAGVYFVHEDVEGGELTIDYDSEVEVNIVINTRGQSSPEGALDGIEHVTFDAQPDE